MKTAFFVLMLLWSFWAALAATDVNYTIQASGTTTPNETFDYTVTAFGTERVPSADATLSIDEIGYFATRTQFLAAPDGTTIDSNEFIPDADPTTNRFGSTITVSINAERTLATVTTNTGGSPKDSGNLDGEVKGTVVLHCSTKYPANGSLITTGTKVAADGSVHTFATATPDPVATRGGTIFGPYSYSVSTTSTTVVVSLGVDSTTTPATLTLSAHSTTNETVAWSATVTGSFSITTFGIDTIIPTDPLPTAPNGDTAYSVTDNSASVDTSMVDNVLHALQRDVTSPHITCSVALTVLKQANKGLVDVGLSVSASDNVGVVGYSISVTQDEALSTSGVADAAAQRSGAGAGAGAIISLKLRPDASAKGDGRVYLIRVDASDAAGNTSSAFCTVVVPINGSPKALADVQQQAQSALTNGGVLSVDSFAGASAEPVADG